MAEMSDSRQLVDILALAPLERHALLSSRQQRRKVFAAYLAIREKVAVDFLPLINSREPYINDHSREHLARVLANAEGILQHNFPKPSSVLGDIPQDRLITWADTVILLNALAWHDIGNIYGRRQHGKQVRRCLEAIAPQLYDSHLRDYIIEVAEAHSGSDAIRKAIPAVGAVGSYQGENIHPRFLAAVLRFADEIDEDHRRTVPNDWDRLRLIPCGSKRFWYFSTVNSSIKVECRLEEQNVSYWVRVDSHVPRSEFSRRFVYEFGLRKVRAMTEYLRRLLRIESERQYCNGFLRGAYSVVSRTLCGSAGGLAAGIFGLGRFSQVVQG
jgi:hypothetical protein